MPNAKLCRLVVLIMMAGCTTQPAKDQGAAKVKTASADVQCHVDQVTGSLVAKKVCTTQAQRDAQQAEINDIQRNVGGRCQGDGCH